RHQAIKPGSGRRMKNPWTPDLTIAHNNLMTHVLLRIKRQSLRSHPIAEKAVTLLFEFDGDERH
ncbi:hypothetical protein, partial [Celeribacter halophilus]|uniref:hypothetical protein n=1 Tax=Celeribacter halophilus TaxID=576117 RepID=UPI003A91E9AA